MQNYKKLGLILKQKRLESKTPVHILAQVISSSPSCYYKMEQGIHRTNTLKFRRLLDFYKISYKK